MDTLAKLVLAIKHVERAPRLVERSIHLQFRVEEHLLQGPFIKLLFAWPKGEKIVGLWGASNASHILSARLFPKIKVHN